jgi:hypothetical protein
MVATSCPRCGGEAPPQASRCPQCGFVFFEERRPRRRVVRLAPRLISLVIVAAALAAGLALLLSRREPAAAPQPPEPVAVARAEQRLESRFANAGYDDTAAVRCRRAISLGGATRCQVRYANGDTQLILVGLDGRGELDITIPYPAQRRPGG